MGALIRSRCPDRAWTGGLQSAVVEVQAKGHRCTMLRSVPATKQNDPIRYSQLLMLPLGIWRAQGQGLGSSRRKSGLSFRRRSSRRLETMNEEMRSPLTPMRHGQRAFRRTGPRRIVVSELDCRRPLSRDVGCNLPVEKVVDQRADPVEVLFQCEMAGVEQVKFDVFQVPLRKTCALDREDPIVLAPDNERRRLMRSKITLPGGVGLKVRLGIVQNGELDFLVAWAVLIGLIEDPVIWTDELRAAGTVNIVPLCTLDREQPIPQRFLVGDRTVLPIRKQRLGEVLVYPFEIRFAVLNHQGGDAVRMFHGEAITDRRADIRQVHGIGRKLEPVRELLHHV